MASQGVLAEAGARQQRLQAPVDADAKLGRIGMGRDEERSRLRAKRVGSGVRRHPKEGSICAVGLRPK